MNAKHAVDRKLFFLFTLLFLTTSAFAENWRTVTSGWRPSRIEAAAGYLYAASEGGLLRVNPGTGTLRLFNVDDGLFHNNLTVVAVTPGSNTLWLGYDNGGIDIVDPVTMRVVQRIRDFFNDENVAVIHDIFVSGEQAFVATNVGISRLSYSNGVGPWVVVDTYRAFGPWPRSTEMLRVIVHDGYVYAGGRLGVARGRLEENLFESANWEVFRFVEDLGISGDAVTYARMLKVLDGTPYLIAYNQGVFKFESGGFQPIPTDFSSFGMTVDGEGDLYLGTYTGLRKYSSAENRFVGVDSDFKPKFFDLTTLNGKVCGAIDTNLDYIGGIASWEGDGYNLYYPNSPGGDQISQLATAPDGSIWAAATSTIIAGYYRFKDDIWTSHTMVNHPEVELNRQIGVTAMGFDRDGDTWVTTWGRGVYYLTQTIAGRDTILEFNSTNSSLQAISPPPATYTVVSGLALDPSGGLWLGNQGAHDGHTVVFIPPDWFDTPLEFRDHTNWIRYGVQQGLNVPSAGPMVVDRFGRLWVESLQADTPDRLTVLDPKGDPTDIADTEVTVVPMPTEMTDYGPVFDMSLDRDGILYLGTPAGLYSVNTNLADPSQATFTRMYGILGETVYAVTIDPIGQIWVGTEFGVSVVGRDRYSIVRRYTTSEGVSPSPLINNRITSITIDPSNGDAYIGTQTGLSVVTTPFRNFADQLGEIEVAPQPFLVGDGQTGNLVFGTEALVAGAKVRIFTPSGKFVRELSFETAAATGWDGRQENGEWVGSGVYLLLVTDSSGNSKTGKVAVIRR